MPSERSTSERSTKDDYRWHRENVSTFTWREPWRPTQEQTESRQDGSRAQKWSRDAGSDDNGRSPKRNVGGKTSLEAKITARASNWQSDERSTRRIYWQTEQWRSNDGSKQQHEWQDEWQGDKWRSASHRTLDIPRRSNTRCKANETPDCRFWPQKKYRINVCDRCGQPKTCQGKAMTFDGQFVSTDHRGRTLQEMEASWRRNEGAWRWLCTPCHQQPGESVRVKKKKICFRYVCCVFVCLFFMVCSFCLTRVSD